MTPEVILAFVLGLIGGFITACLVIWGLIKRVISISVMKKAEADNDMFDEDK